MFTPNELFESKAAPHDLLSHAAFLERARDERERGHEAASQLALGAYLVARLADRLVPATEGGEEEIEGLRWQLQSTQRFIRELPAAEVEASHLAAIVDAVASPPPHRDSVLRMSLVAYAYYLEQEGRLVEALEVLGATGRTYGAEIPQHECPSLALFVGRLNRILARWGEANRAYDVARKAALAIGDARSALISRLGRANVLRDRGNLPKARTAVEAIIAEAERLHLTDVQAYAYDDLGAVLGRQGFVYEAISAAYRAFVLHQDSVQRWRALCNLAVELRALGAYDAARLAFGIVLRGCDTWSIHTNALIEMLELESATGNEMAFQRYVHQAEERVDRMPPSMDTDFRFKTGIGLARFGRLARARRMLSEALELAEDHSLNEWYFRVDRTLRGLDLCPTPVTEELRMAGAEHIPAIVEVSAGLEQYAAGAMTA